MKQTKKQFTRLKAFTLTEMLVTLAIFGFIMMTFSTILITLINTSYTNDARTGLRQSLSFASNMFSEYMQNANPMSVASMNTTGQLYELKFADKSPTPKYYKFSFKTESVSGKTLGRLYLYNCGYDATCTATTVTKQLLTYRDVNIDNNQHSASDPMHDTQRSYFTFQKITDSATGETFVMATMFLEADSTYLGHKGLPVGKNLRRITSIEIK